MASSSISLRPKEVLFACNSRGRVFYLNSNNDGNLSSVASSKWLELPYLGIDFKRISAAHPCQDDESKGFSGYGGRLWAIGGDHQVYVFSYGAEVPIRVKEVSYENQRWNPLEGFGSKLLPTDRPNFSNGEGTIPRVKSSIKLPTLAWEWDSEWYIDTNFNGKSLDKEGWTYAIDFPAEYSAKKSFTSCVRRRKWIRYRRYVAIDSWSAVPPLHKDISQEPFIDLSVGGHEIPNGDPSELQVWAVTVMGRVVVRQGVTTKCPEGTGWLHIPTPNKCEISQISVAAAGLVWAVTWNGNALIRLGVTRLDPTGTHWCELESPDPKSRLCHVSVGSNSIWALSRNRRVWFRNGIRSNSAGENDNLARGSKWIEMVGELHMITIGPKDQVFGVNDEDHSIIFRSGVTPSDLSGKTWQPLTAQTVRMRNFSDSSSISTSSSSIVNPETSNSRDGSDSTALPNNTTFVHAGSSNAHFKRLSLTSQEDSDMKRMAVSRTGMPDQSMYLSALDSIDKIKLSEAIDEESDADNVFEEENTQKDESNQSLDSVSVNSNRPNVIDFEDHYDEDISEQMLGSCDSHWLWVTGGSCVIDPTIGPPDVWFKENSVSKQSLAGEAWRIEILQSLKANNETISQNERYSHYASAIERTSWVRKGEATFHSGDPKSRFEKCSVELEQTGSPQGGIDFGTLSIFGTSRRNKEHLSLFEITCVNQSAEKTLSLHTASRSKKLQPLQIKFNSDSEMEVWQADMINGMNSVRGISGTPTFPNSIFTVTNRGEVLVFDPKFMSAEETEAVSNDFSGKSKSKSQKEGQYMQDIDVKDHVLPIVKHLENGFGPGSLLSLTLKIPNDAERFSLNFQYGQPSLDADIALHFNPRLDKNETVLNSKQKGEWGLEEKQPLCIFLEDGNAFKAFNANQTVQVVFKSTVNFYEVFVNGTPYCRFNHRIKPEEITHFRLGGDIEPKSVVYHSKSIIIPPNQMYWRVLGGGHFLQVETCASGVTWALGYDYQPWVYTGGWGGAHFKGSGSTSKFGIGPVEDTKFFYVYENQRWNPLTGYTSHGLPTDRYSWSDRTGRFAMSKESVRPPSLHWHWVTDWMIDFTTPGGVDKDGFQYATDFPTSYHGKPRFTDYVRRRRWARKCQVHTSGPWRQVGNTKLVDISLKTRPNTDLVDLWAVASNGEVLYRENVRMHCPEGSRWKQVHNDTSCQSISVGDGGQIWAVGREGSAFLRHGVTKEAPTGQFWLQVHPPTIFGNDKSANLRSIAVGTSGASSFVWALDASNRLLIRQEVSKVFPEGTNWAHVCSDVKTISAQYNELWAVLEEATPTTLALVGGIVTALQQQGLTATTKVNNSRGLLARRVGITPDVPMGNGWDISIGGGWKHVSIRAKYKR